MTQKWLKNDSKTTQKMIKKWRKNDVNEDDPNAQESTPSSSWVQIAVESDGLIHLSFWVPVKFHLNLSIA